MKESKLIFLFLCLFFATYLKAFSMEMRGYTIVQSSTSGRMNLNQKNLLSRVEFSNINRFNFLHEFTRHPVLFEMGIELNQLYEINNSPSLSPYQSINSSYRLFKENPILVNRHNLKDNNYLILGQIDRLSTEIELSRSSLIIGRQQINFGISKLSSPLDHFLPFQVAAINKEERSGVDAIRYKYSLGEMGEFGLGVIAGFHFKKETSAGFINLKLPNEILDVEFLLTEFLSAHSLGFNMLKSFQGTNTWFEYSYTKPKQDFSYQRLTLGTEYQWNSSLYTIFEYHHNGPGKKNAEDYLLGLNEFAYTSRSSYLLGRDYLNFLLNYQVGALTAIQTGLILNISDQSLLLNLSSSRSLGNNQELDLGLFQGIGQSNPSTLDWRSEFSGYGSQLYVKFKSFF